MPDMPSAINAARTSSNLKGLMMAVIIFGSVENRVGNRHFSG
jgi:hypothetical protein